LTLESCFVFAISQPPLLTKNFYAESLQ